MAYAMEDLGWKFYFINAAWNLVFLVSAYFTFVETKGLSLEEIASRFEGSAGEVVVGVEREGSTTEVETDGKGQNGVFAGTREL